MYALEGSRVVGTFADVAALEAMVPAARNQGRYANTNLVPPFQEVRSDGVTWLPTSGDVQGQLAAITASIPAIASTPPVAEATTASAGQMPAASAADHVHPRLTSATYVTLDANGLATATFSQQFVLRPTVVLSAVNPSGKQVSAEVQSFVMASGKFAGCVVKGYRAQNLPAVLTLLSGLINYDVTAGSVGGVDVGVTAIKTSA